MPASPTTEWTDDGRERCDWATGPWLAPYHDEEWGVPVHDDRRHFEFLTLEAAQAGLSWLTVLKRRDGYRRAFAGFAPEKVARFGPRKVEALLGDTGIIRNRLKIESTVANAAAFLRVQEELGSFDAYLWAFVEGTPVVQPMGIDARDPGQHAAVDGGERRPAAPGIPVRRAHGDLRPPAGGRAGRRPPHHLLSLSRAGRVGPALAGRRRDSVAPGRRGGGGAGG